MGKTDYETFFSESQQHFCHHKDNKNSA